MSWSLVAAVVLAVALGGDLRRFFSLRIHAWWLLVLALVVKVALLLLHAPVEFWAQPLIFGLVAAAAVANWRLSGIPAIALGLSLNAAVVLANGGVMPFEVSQHPAAQRAATAVSEAENSHSRLAWLDDRIPFAPTGQVFSLGDLVIMLGGAWLIVGLTEPRRLHFLQQA